MRNVAIAFFGFWLLVGSIWILPTASAMAEPTATPTEQVQQEDIETVEDLVEQALTATQAGNFAEAERYWSQSIDKMPNNPALWSNRGNARLSQNRVREAIADYNRAIELYPQAPDAYLNRGIAWERLQKWEKAIADYNQVLEITPDDPIAYNNRGNAKAGALQWQEAADDYQKAVDLAPEYAFARANHTLALYELGKTQKAIRELRNLVRKYPKFADMRAALTAALWEQGSLGEAESHWYAAVGLDARYRDMDWVRQVRRWPPTIANALERFQNVE